MCFAVNSLEELLYRTPVKGYLCFREKNFNKKNFLTKNFTINYDLAKYLTTLTIIINFAENICNFGVAMKQSENPI